MADFPVARAHKPLISCLGLEAAGPTHMGENVNTGGAGASAVWPSANLAIFVPFFIVSPYLIRTLWWSNGTAVAGNVDCGVYSAGGTLLVNAGSTAQATVSIQQKVSLGTPFLLVPGSYYMALSASSASATFIRIAPAAPILQYAGLAQQASAVPLPATFTLASLSNQYVPLFGIARQTVM